jgi:hypothetical protein
VRIARAEPSEAGLGIIEPVAGQPMRTPIVEVPRWRRGLVSIFVVFHLVALLWWNCGVVQYRPAELARPDDAFSRFRAGAEVVDPSGGARSTLEAYMRGSGLWQRWILFGPDAPHETGRFEVFGVEAVGPDGAPELDPDPVHTSDSRELLDHTQLIGLVPCGFPLQDDPRATFLRASYAAYHVREGASRRGVQYVGAHFVCHVRELPTPDRVDEEFPWRTIVLWSGPLPPVEGS